MENEYTHLDTDYMLTAKQYYELYCKAFYQLDELATRAEQAMKTLEELQLKMGDDMRPAPIVSLLPPPQRQQEQAEPQEQEQKEPESPADQAQEQPDSPEAAAK